MHTSSLLATIVAFSQVIFASPVATDSHLQRRQDGNTLQPESSVDPNTQGSVWRAYCLSDTSNLDQSGIDQSSDALRNKFGASMTLTSDSGSHALAGTPFNAVSVYGCVGAYSYSETFSAADVDAALRAMDAACPRYASSWAILTVPDPAFNGQLFNSAKVIGKDVSSPLNAIQSVCMKNFGWK